jgi:uncharacterized membrane protein
MENLVVASFQSLEDANRGLVKLKELDELGDIAIYNLVLIQKKTQDSFEILFHDGPDTQDLPAEGVLLGSAVGLLGGPVGMALGMIAGVTIGTVDEQDTEEFFGDFLHKVNRRLASESYAIVMDVDEDDPIFLDSYLAPYQGAIVRTELRDEYNRYNRKEAEELDKEIDDAENEWKRAAEKDKAAIKEKIDKLKIKREERIKKLKTRIAKSKDDIHDKLKTIEQKIATAKGKRKERLKVFREKFNKKLDAWDEAHEWIYM